MKQKNKFKKIAKIVVFIAVMIAFSFTAFAQDYDVISDGSQWYVCDAHDAVSGQGIEIADGSLLSTKATSTLKSNVQIIVTDQASSASVPSGSSNIGGETGGSTKVVDINSFFDTIDLVGVYVPSADPFFPGWENQLPGDPASQAVETIARRFLCYQEGSRSPFAECCGFTLDRCTNPDGSKIRRTGEVSSVIEEYPCTSVKDANCVLKIGIEQAEIYTAYKMYVLELTATGSQIYNWDPYDYLEFYINFVRDTHLRLMILNTDPDGRPGFPTSYQNNILFDADITDFVVNDISLLRWLHVKIPLDFDKSTVRTLVFYEAKENLPYDPNDYLIDRQLSEIAGYRNIIGLDRIFLSRDDQPRFCSATSAPTWINDLDNNVKDNFGVPAGKLPCILTPGYAWTGTQCCGDDQTHNYDETYNDDEDGCWRGQVVRNNTAVRINIAPT